MKHMDGYVYFMHSVWTPPLCRSSFHSPGDIYIGSTPNTKNVSLEQQYLQHDEGWPLRTQPGQ